LTALRCCVLGSGHFPLGTVPVLGPCNRERLPCPISRMSSDDEGNLSLSSTSGKAFWLASVTRRPLRVTQHAPLAVFLALVGSYSLWLFHFESALPPFFSRAPPPRRLLWPFPPQSQKTTRYRYGLIMRGSATASYGSGSDCHPLRCIGGCDHDSVLTTM